METQNQIKRILSYPSEIEHVKDILTTSGNLNRTKLAELVCDRFGFLDPLGKKQTSGCIKALRELEQKGHFLLPTSSSTKVRKKSPTRATNPIPKPLGLPDQAGNILDLQLVTVESDEQMRIWNELMIQDHPLGAGPLVGRQYRYLVQSEYGWLGGFAFSSSALRLEDRDKWLGWNEETRRNNLSFIVNMNRFLIRSCVSCKNLASRLLGLAIRQLPQDFEKRYGYPPLLLESFVDTSRYPGTSYKAANWKKVGQTKGRGRQDRLNEKKKTIKDIYLYPLHKDFRKKMGLPEEKVREALAPAEGVDATHWAENEFGGAPLGDKRLSQRLVGVAKERAEQPGRAYSGVAKGDWPKVKAYYRLIDKPDDSAVTMSNILLPHRERTISRMKGQKRVLCIQDGCDVSYSSLAHCKGLGVIGSNQTSAQSKGLHLHSTLAITTEGVPLGILKVNCTAPLARSKEERESGKKRTRSSKIPIENKKTFAWIEGVRDCKALQSEIPDTSIINVMDREGDFFELFDDQNSNCSNIDLLVRAKTDRKTTGKHKLFETVRLSSIRSVFNLKIPRQSSRPKQSKQKKRPKRLARTAEVSLRFARVELKAPSDYKGKKMIPIRVIHICEEDPPIDAEPLQWFLLTTLNIESLGDAMNCINWYCLRWRIEDWHRVLKSGCGVEKLAHKTAERLRRAIAINVVIAWRIMLMTLLGREGPGLPRDLLFSDLEIKVLEAYAQKKSSIVLNV